MAVKTITTVHGTTLALFRFDEAHKTNIWFCLCPSYPKLDLAKMKCLLCCGGFENDYDIMIWRLRKYEKKE